jgi:hypothetical protein
VSSQETPNQQRNSGYDTCALRHEEGTRVPVRRTLAVNDIATPTTASTLRMPLFRRLLGFAPTWTEGAWVWDVRTLVGNHDR